MVKTPCFIAPSIVSVVGGSIPLCLHSRLTIEITIIESSPLGGKRIG